jgi:hypothetical protein
MCFGGGGNSGASNLNAANDAATQANLQLAQQQRADELARQANVNSSIDAINKQFSGFDNNFYNNLGQNYLSYYQPQLNQQYGQTQQNDLFQLARQGIVNSSGAAKVYGDLARDAGNQNIALQSQANNYIQQARGEVENQRNALINQATATANPTAAANAATNAVGALQMIQPAGGYSPLGGLFNTFSGAAANGIQNYAYGNQGGLLGQIFKPSGGGNSSRVIP